MRGANMPSWATRVPAAPWTTRGGSRCTLRKQRTYTQGGGAPCADAERGVVLAAVARMRSPTLDLRMGFMGGTSGPMVLAKQHDAALLPLLAHRARRRAHGDRQPRDPHRRRVRHSEQGAHGA